MIRIAKMFRVLPLALALALFASACAEEKASDTDTTKPAAEVTEESADHIPGSHDEEGEHDEASPDGASGDEECELGEPAGDDVAEGEHDMDAMDDGEVMDDADGEVLGPEPFNGTFKGTWTNYTSCTTGPGSLIVAVDAPGGEVTFTLDLDGDVFFGGDPPAVTVTARIDNGAVVFDDLAGGILGTISGTISPTGYIDIKGTAPVPDILYLTMQGQTQPAGGKVEFKIFLADGTTTVGLMDLSKV